MEGALYKFLKLNGEITSVNVDSFNYKLEVKDENIQILKELYDAEFIEEIIDSNGLIIIIANLFKYINHRVSIEFIISEFKKIGFYLTLQDFIVDNRFEIPTEFHISEISYQSGTKSHSLDIEKYKAVTSLIERLTYKAKFVSEEHNKTLFLVQDNSFIEIPIENVLYEEFVEQNNIELIKSYIKDIDSYKEKSSIYLKELIDFLSNKAKGERLRELIFYFNEFYERCNTSFEFYLANFSYNKIKLELDNSVLDYSKNIRSIINDSQSKLIAIPAAFILGVSQVSFLEPLILKNLMIIASAFLFSYIISIFIKNQKNALVIITDNLFNYKANYKRSKITQFDFEKDLESLTELINNSYIKIEDELVQQSKRLDILQICNWGISIILLCTVLIIAIVQNSSNIAALRDRLPSIFPC